MHPRPKAAPKRESNASIPARDSRQRRGAAPTDLSEPKFLAGPSNSTARAGPGRGHTFERVTLPVGAPDFVNLAAEHMPSAPTGNWLEQLAQRKAWQTEEMSLLRKKIRELEHALLARDARVGQLEETVSRLRERVCQFSSLIRHL